MKPRSVKLYYWRTVPNWGDMLAADVLRRFSNVSTRWASPETADVITVGSVIQHMPLNWRGTILGAGLLQPNGRVPLGSKVMAVRGPLTRKSIGTSETVLGDPGLLAAELVKPVPRVRNLGILAHWTDKDLAKRPEFLQYDPLIINAQDDHLKVIQQIASCRKLVTSSLHGVIIADALAIPRRVELPPTKYQHPSEHGVFKFEDYHASIGMKFETGVTRAPEYGLVQDRQHELYDCFREYGKS